MYKTVLKSIGSTRSAGTGFLPLAKDLPINKPLQTTFASSQNDGGSFTQLNGVANPEYFEVGNLVNIRIEPNPSIDTTIVSIVGDVIVVSAPYSQDTGAGILSQRFQPPISA